jgi:2-amino-4-hydroxy-6-hydroxymethyldihydropteridine diphosphokinase
MQEIAYLGIGANLGDKLGNCLKAIELIHAIEGCAVERISSFYRTEPLGVENQEWYVNAALCVTAEIGAPQLLAELQNIEAGIGRERKERWEARPIDLDILLFGQAIIEGERLTVPHPWLHMRRFVLVPLVELSPQLVHPVLRKTMAQLLENIPEKGQAVIPMEAV